MHEKVSAKGKQPYNERERESEKDREGERKKLKERQTDEETVRPKYSKEYLLVKL